MGSVRRLQYTDRKTGKAKKTPRFYACFTDHTGTQRRVPGFPDRAATLQLLARLEREAAEVRAGLRTPGSPDRHRPLTELFADYKRIQKDRGLSDGHRRNCSVYLPEVFVGCKWVTFAGVNADSLVTWMRRKLEGDPDAAEGERRTCSPATVNGYWSAAKAFSKWAAERCGTLDPLAKVKKLNEEVDRRRSRRIPTPAELLALCAAAGRCPRRRGQKAYMVSGPDRGMLYRVAAYTGFRASELASLTPDSFTLAAGVPVAVTVLAADSKGGRTETVPVPAHLAAALGPWLAARPAGGFLWPGDWAENRGQWNWLRRDLARAGISQEPEPLTFHSLRAMYVTAVIEAGATIPELQKMARHKSALTSMRHYARVKGEKLQSLADSLPPPEPTISIPGGPTS